MRLCYFCFKSTILSRSRSQGIYCSKGPQPCSVMQALMTVGPGRELGEKDSKQGLFLASFVRAFKSWWQEAFVIFVLNRELV